MKHTNSDARKRIVIINELLKRHKDDDDPSRYKVTPYAALRRGYISNKYQVEVTEMESTIGIQSNEPLSFSELMSYSTFFYINPEKICGQEYISGSGAFKIKVKGTQHDVTNTIHTTIERLRRIRIAKAKLSLYAYSESKIS